MEGNNKGEIPYRIDLAGGWLDQPFVSKMHPGAVITISIKPNKIFNRRSGLASSTREAATELWEKGLPKSDLEKTAKILFSYENPPGTRYISGSQDSIGIVFPGVSKSTYNGKYWPESIENVKTSGILDFIENSLHLISLGPRENSYDVLARSSITKNRVKKLSDATERCWKNIQNKDIQEFGLSLREAFEAQIKMFPNMLTENARDAIERHKNKALGWKLTGAGGGGYLVLVSDKNVPNSIRINIRRK